MDELTEDAYTVNCYESGVEFRAFRTDQQQTYDPSRVLSPYTAERLSAVT